MDLPVIVRMPPMLYTDTKGQKWAVSGQFWLPVPETATLDSIDDVMIYKARVDPPQSTNIKSWSVQGSKGNTYTVTYNGHVWGCSCPGFGWRRKCRHITEKMHENR
jgi:hypothetical protein